MTDKDSLHKKVRDANKLFYNNVADIYEEIDGRRTDDLKKWLSNSLKVLSNSTTGKVLLDVGCGSGFAMDSGKEFFSHLYGIDISLEILKESKDKSKHLICGEVSYIPLKDNSVDVVVCLAVLHHIYNHKPLIKEIYRVLKKDGVLYTDHDMDKTFNKQFKIPLVFYRIIFDACKKYKKAKKEITGEMYRLSEIHSDGIDSYKILSYLEVEGFSDINCYFHWFGLNGVLNRIFKQKFFKNGLAPLVSIRAVKK